MGYLIRMFVLLFIPSSFFFFFFNDTATPEIYTLSLHDALPICVLQRVVQPHPFARSQLVESLAGDELRDRKSTRLNSSHANISYAVFCLKKKKKKRNKEQSI